MNVLNNRVKILILIYIFCAVFFLEFLVYYYSRGKWPENKCGGLSDYHKVLVVADPQILGENTESWIARWDSDKFLKKTFLMAYWHVRPSLVIFLGDLMDEGSIATDSQYIRYLERFKDIFHLDTLLKNKTLFLPGDNDIGGENEEITSLKVDRFAKHFGLNAVTTLDNVKFLSVNVMLEIFPNIKKQELENVVSVALSHMPLLARPSIVAKKALLHLKPDIIFSAHNHISVHLVTNSASGELIFTEPLTENKFANSRPIWRFQLDKNFPNEILVPTCSYRMGVESLAYGVIMINKRRNDLACYNLLWLPNRLFHLKLYMYLSITAFVLLTFLVSFRPLAVLFSRQHS